MIVFDVELNGEPYCRAGIDGHGVISLMLHWMDFDGRTVTDERDHLRSALSLNVSGHRAARAFTDADVAEGREPPPMTPIHWREVKQGLVVGDELRIRVVESEEADEPTETPMFPAPAEGQCLSAGAPPQNPVHRPDESREYLSGEGCHILELSGAGHDPALSIARARVEPGVTTELHALDGIYERYLVVSGRGDVELETVRDRHAVHPGDVVLIPPGVPQRITNTGQEDLVFYCLCTPPWREEAYLTLES